MGESGVRFLEIGDSEAGQRLDNFLLRILKGVPRSHIYKILRSGEVRINRGRAQASYHLQQGDMVRVPPVRQAEPVPESRVPEGIRRELFQRILYEDDRVLVLDKPSGMAVHGGSGVSWGVIEALRQLRPDLGELELVHRLDRETSGCLLLSKRRSALRRLHAAMREEGLDKHYLVLACGRWKGEMRRVDLALRKNTLQSGERMVRPDPETGKPSATRFFPVQRFSGETLLRAELETGRTHQIRVHLQAIGHPVAGDPKYGDAACNSRLRQQGLRRLFLHAALLGFPHPGDGRIIRVEAPLPADLAGVVAALEQEGQTG